jgi:antirestriction protein
MRLSIYLTNLGKYNEGELVGEWVNLPITDEELEAVLDRIGIDEEHEETFITDYECDNTQVEIREYTSVEDLNEMAEAVADFDEIENAALEAFLYFGYDFADAVEGVKNYEYRSYDGAMSMEDVAYEVVEEHGYLNGVPKIVARYFDYEAFGRDLEIEGDFYSYDNGYIEVLR